MKYLIALVFMVFLDFGWAKYIKNISDLRPFHAAVWSVIIYVIGASVVLLVVEDSFIIVPASIGTFIGTYMGVINEKNTKKPTKQKEY
jgi:hypothetical protein